MKNGAYFDNYQRSEWWSVSLDFLSSEHYMGEVQVMYSNEKFAYSVECSLKYIKNCLYTYVVHRINLKKKKKIRVIFYLNFYLKERNLWFLKWIVLQSRRICLLTSYEILIFYAFGTSKPQIVFFISWVNLWVVVGEPFLMIS